MLSLFLQPKCPQTQPTEMLPMEVVTKTSPCYQLWFGHKSQTERHASYYTEDQQPKPGKDKISLVFCKYRRLRVTACSIRSDWNCYMKRKKKS